MRKFLAVSAFLVAILCVFSDAIFEIDAARLRADSQSALLAFVCAIVSYKIAGLILGIVSGSPDYDHLKKRWVFRLFVVLFLLISVLYSVVMTVISQSAYTDDNEHKQDVISQRIDALQSEAAILTQSIQVCNNFNRPSNCLSQSARVAEIQREISTLSASTKHTAKQTLDEVANFGGIDPLVFKIVIFSSLSFLISVLPFVMSAVAAHYWGPVRGLQKNTTGDRSRDRSLQQKDNTIRSAMRIFAQKNSIENLTPENVIQACKEINGRGISKDRARRILKEDRKMTQQKSGVSKAYSKESKKVENN
jgi:hypothetical protein